MNILDTYIIIIGAIVLTSIFSFVAIENTNTATVLITDIIIWTLLGVWINRINKKRKT